MPKRSSLALDSIIRRRIETSKRGTGLGIPSDRDGRDGTVKVFRTKDGVSLFGKIGRKWYKFASGSKVGPSGKHNPKEIGGSENLGNLNLTGIFKLKKAKFSVNELNYLQIDSQKFDIETSNTVSKLSIGDISLQPTWGTTGADITLEGASNNSSSHITIQGGNSTGGNNDGGNVYIAAGGKAGLGADGVIGLNHTGAANRGSYLDMWSHVRLKADKKLYFDGVEDTTGMLDTAGNTYIYANSDDTDILDFKVGNVTMLKLDETNDKIQFKGGAIELLDTTDTADLFSITVGASGVTTIATVDDGAAVGHLTLQPDGDLVLDPASGKIIINATDKLYFDGGGSTYINEPVNGTMYFACDNVILLGLVEGSTECVDVLNADLTIPAAKKIFLDGDAASGHTYITETSDDVLDFYVGTDKMLVLDEASDTITMAATNWIAGTVSGATVTEFSSANSAYAGMVLGYTCIGLNEARASYNLTTSYAVPTDEFSVEFTAPPSGNVEIFIQFTWSAGSSNAGDCYAGLSTANATSGYSATISWHEKEIFDAMSRGAYRTLTHRWTITGLTAGTSYERWVGFKSSSTTGTPQILYGGDASGEYPNFIMKATALPA